MDKKTINQIAAGEVVERPASVVKELLENAVDAKSKRIVVELKNAGKKLIRVTDDGDGIAPYEMKLAFQKHSTSKINKIEDIFNLKTLGFRGEALASIAAVSVIECISCKGKGLPGRKILLDGGQEKSFTEIGCAKGTTIKIKNLFYNIPARLKYLKTEKTELAHVIDAITHMALFHNQIGFKLIHNNHDLLNFPPTKNQVNNLINIYGKELVRELLPLNTDLHQNTADHIAYENRNCYSNDDFDIHSKIKISGFIGKPSLTRSDRTYQTTFVNGRYIESTTIHNAIKDAYKTLVMKHRHPVVILYINADPRMFDINISPTKTRIRFEDESKLYNLVYRTVHESLKSNDLIPEATIPQKPRNVTLKAITTLGTGKPGYLPTLSSSDQPDFERSKENKEHLPLKFTQQSTLGLRDRRFEQQLELTPASDFELEMEGGVSGTESAKLSRTRTAPGARNGTETSSTLKYIHPVGQVMDTYIIAQAGSAMYIIDQHAASERIMYERIKDRYDSCNMSTQELLHPVELELSAKELGLLKSNLEILKTLNFVIDELGENKFYVKGIPVILGRLQDKELVHDIVNDLITITTEKQHHIIKDKMMQIMACKAAIKAGKPMTIPEIQQLLNDLDSIENPYTCAHGRPTIISLSDLQLRKLFKRIV